ncbi:MAG TPA: N-acetylmuramoyl-L-alanine amidase [Candidatus Acidoferrales bacterium]|nr:N-acetylmuramoyl-L-alanine amidase [Candidatus Acidoferrales bacterium]
MKPPTTREPRWRNHLRAVGLPAANLWQAGLGLLLGLTLASGLLGAEPGNSRSERLRVANLRLEQANRLRADLQGTPEDKRLEKEYLRAVFLYRRVYDLAPFSSIAPDALAAAAEVYHDMAKQFDPKYWRKAIETYEFLRSEYPHSRYQDDALFNIAQLYHVHLKDLDAGLKTYQEFLNTYPRSHYAATARERIKAIEAEQTAAASASAPPPPETTSDDRVEVRNIRYWNAENYTRVVVDLEGEVKYQGARIANPDRIFFDLFHTRLSTVLSGKSFEIEEGLLSRIRIGENRAGVSRVVLEVKNAENYSFFSLPNPFRLVVDIRGPAPTQAARKAAEPPPPVPVAKAKPAAAVEPPKAETATLSVPQPTLTVPQPPSVPKPTADGNHTLSRALGLKVGRIVLDAGHGGHDTGTIGPTGLMEKDLVLDVARRLGRMIEEQLGAEVIYTREDDSFVPLENRIALANEKQADLFISIHANSSRARAVRGVETYFLNFTTDPEALELAARENALSQKSVHELQDLVRSISRNEKVNESRELARAIQHHLHGELRKASRTIQNRGVRQAPFVVLIGGSMPSILTEVAFLSNPQDEKLLKSPEGRQAVAGGLYAGMSKYLVDTNSVAFASEKAPAPPSE